MAYLSIDPSSDELVHSESSVFNYMTSNVLLEKVLPDRRLRFKNLTLTNDPYEYTHITGYSAPYDPGISQRENPFYMDTVRQIARLRKRCASGVSVVMKANQKAFSIQKVVKYYIALNPGINIRGCGLNMEKTIKEPVLYSTRIY